jgi:hypothetical protein
MSPVRPNPGIRWLVSGCLLLFLAISSSGCSLFNKLPGKTTSEEGRQEATAIADHGPCLPTYGTKVEAAGMSADGQRLVYLTAARPAGLAEGVSWLSTDRAVQVLDLAGTPTTRLLVRTWEQSPEDQIAVYPTDIPNDQSPPKATVLSEQMTALMLSETGNRFLLGVTREGVQGGLAKIYTGIVPEGDTELSPENGLTLVRINDYLGTEGVQGAALSPDGSRMAALVGLQGELRVYDFAADKLYVYSQGEGGKVEITNELPKAATSIQESRIPALAHTGVMRLQWAPDNKRLAISRYESVGVAGVWVVDYTTGQATLIRTFSNTTIPHVVWSKDGTSVFTLSTRLFQGNVLGDSEVRRIKAVEDGKDIGDRWQLAQVPGYRTAPADFTGYGDDQNFLLTWEQQLWLLQVPESGTGPASYGPVTLNPPTMMVQSGNITASATADRAAFLVNDHVGTHVGLRLAVTQETCAAEATQVRPPTTGEATEPAALTPAVEGVSEPTAETPQGAVPATAAASEPATEAPAGAGTQGATGGAETPQAGGQATATPGG